MNPLKPEAIKILRRVKRHILARPTRLCMSKWLIKKIDSGREDYYSGDWDGAKFQKYPPCGTAACLAGWTTMIALPEREIAAVNVEDIAARELGLDYTQKHKLFYVAPICTTAFGWPEPFRSDYLKAKSQTARARIAAARIDHFIATGGNE